MRLKARGAAVALQHPKLPLEVRRRKEELLKHFLQREELSESDLEEARHLECKARAEGCGVDLVAGAGGGLRVPGGAVQQDLGHRGGKGGWPGGEARELGQAEFICFRLKSMEN